jgi:hypothetical protein
MILSERQYQKVVVLNNQMFFCAESTLEISLMQSVRSVKADGFCTPAECCYSTYLRFCTVPPEQK